jgi:alpha-ketoglutarate-dependent taurine dioxygenase
MPHIIQGLENTTADIVRGMIGEHRTVIIRNVDPVSPERLVVFYKELGAVVQQNDKVTGTIGSGELIRVKADGLFSGAVDGELEWHSAGMNRSGHDDIVAMYMHQPAESGGVTHFTDHQAAFASLDEPTKTLCRKIQSKIITYNSKMKLDRMHYKNVFSDEQTMMEFRDITGDTSFNNQTPRKPLVTTHPINGKEGLYFPWSVIRGFTNLAKNEQKELYYKLKQHTLSDEYIYSHTWNPYDIILSDQHHSLHKRDAYNGNRELWRAGIWLRPEFQLIDEWSCESLMPSPDND